MVGMHLAIQLKLDELVGAILLIWTTTLSTFHKHYQHLIRDHLHAWSRFDKRFIRSMYQLERKVEGFRTGARLIGRSARGQRRDYLADLHWLREATISFKGLFDIALRDSKRWCEDECELKAQREAEEE
jgi:hypothetical protein